MTTDLSWETQLLQSTHIRRLQRLYARMGVHSLFREKSIHDAALASITGSKN